MPQIPFSKKQLDDFVNRKFKDVQVRYGAYSMQGINFTRARIAQMMDSIEDDMKRKKEKENSAARTW